MTGDLEGRLADLGAHLAAPDGAGLDEQVRRRLEETSPPRVSILRRPRRVLVLAAAVVALGAAAAVAGLSLRGILITVDPTPTATPQAGAPLRLGDPTTLEQARARAGFPILVPTTLGAPDEVWIDDRAAATPVTLVYRERAGVPPSTTSEVSVLLTQLRAGIDEVVIEKIVGSAKDVRSVTVGGSAGFWIRGEHLVSYVAPDGSRFQDGFHLSARTLLWERDGVTFRLESSLSLMRAVGIAESLG